MAFKNILDEHIEVLLLDDMGEKDIATNLLSEECFLESFSSGSVPLLETVRRTIIRSGGVSHVTKRVGRPNPYRSSVAKRSARVHRSSRIRAQRKYRNSAKGKRDKREIQRFNKSRGTSRPRFHGPPRRSRGAYSFKRPTVRRTPGYRPPRRR